MSRSSRGVLPPTRRPREKVPDEEARPHRSVLRTRPHPIPRGVRYVVESEPETAPFLAHISLVSWVEPDEDTVRAEITKRLVHLVGFPTLTGPTAPGRLSQDDHDFVLGCLTCDPAAPFVWEDVYRIQAIHERATALSLAGITRAKAHELAQRLWAGNGWRAVTEHRGQITPACLLGRAYKNDPTEWLGSGDDWASAFEDARTRGFWDGRLPSPLPPKLGLATIDGEVRLVPQAGEILTVPTSAGHHVHNGTDETK